MGIPKRVRLNESCYYAYDAAGNRISDVLTIGGVATTANAIPSGTKNQITQTTNASSVVQRSLTYRPGGHLSQDQHMGATVSRHGRLPP